MFHLAAQAGVRKSWGRDFAVYTENNIEATQCLLEAICATPGIERLVYASSSNQWTIRAGFTPVLELDYSDGYSTGMGYMEKGSTTHPISGAQTRKWLSDKLFGPSDEFTYQGNSGTGSSN